MPFDAQLYRLASVARDKLCREASRASHDLRILVSHANLLDDLLIELSAPRGETAEHYGFDLVPRPVAKAATPRRVRPVVVTIVESSEDELEDEQDFESSAYQASGSTPLNVPMLDHDADSDSDSTSDSASDSDSNSDDGDDFKPVITSNSPPTSPTTSISSTSEDDVEPDEDELALHRTKSGWRLLGNYSSKKSPGQKDARGVSAITNGVQRVNLSST